MPYNDNTNEGYTMTYSESAQGVMITKQRAIQELKAHGVIDVQEFFNDEGERDTYDAFTVLLWLGY